MKGETTEPDMPGAMRGLSVLGALVRRHDRDRYQTAIFAPPAQREALLVLYAFNYEIARVRESVTQPMLGQIRLQWWREVIEAAYAGGATRQHEVVVPLTRIIREYGLSRGHFDRVIDGREQDLSDEPPADLPALEAYAAATSASLISLALEVLGARDAAGDAAESAAAPAGIAHALAGLLRAMAFHARTGRCYIPADMAARHRLDPADYAALRSTPALRAAAAEIAEAASRHLAAARRCFAMVPRAARPALLPTVVAARYLDVLRRVAHDPFAPRLQKPDTLQSWHFAWAMLTGRL